MNTPIWNCSTSTYWALVLIAVLILLYYLGTRNFERFSKYNVPHLKPVPFFGNVGSSVIKRQFFPDLVLDIYNTFKTKPYGGFYMFNIPIIVIIDPELIKIVAVKDFDHFTDHKFLVIDDTGPEAVWGKGLFSLKGQRWREMRSLLTPAFTSSKMKTMFVLISECCKQFVHFLEECNSLKHPGFNISTDGNTIIVELKELFTRYTNDVIATTAFGIGVDSLKEPKNDFYVKGQETVNPPAWKFYGYACFPKFMQKLGFKLLSTEVTQFFTSLLMDTMETRQKKGIVRHDLLQILMEARKNSMEENAKETNAKNRIKLDDEDIIAQSLVFLLAGFDTASTLSCFVSYLLATHPDVQTRLQQEVDETLVENNGHLIYEAVNNMKYLDMVLSETLRLYPPGAAVDRACTRRYTLQADPPLELFPGDVLYIPILGIHRDPKYYPDPDTFDPERFSDENKHNISPSTYIPFGVGPRSCIGSRFALMETKLVLVYMLSRFNLKRIDKTPESIKLIQKGFNISIAGGFWMGIEPRN